MHSSSFFPLYLVLRPLYTLIANTPNPLISHTSNEMTESLVLCSVHSSHLNFANSNARDQAVHVSQPS